MPTKPSSSVRSKPKKDAPPEPVKPQDDGKSKQNKDPADKSAKPSMQPNFWVKPKPNKDSADPPHKPVNKPGGQARPLQKRDSTDKDKPPSRPLLLNVVHYCAGDQKRGSAKTQGGKSDGKEAEKQGEKDERKRSPKTEKSCCAQGSWGRREVERRGARTCRGRFPGFWWC